MMLKQELKQEMKMKKSFIIKIEQILKTQKKELLSKSYSDNDIDMDGDETDEIQAKIIINTTNQIMARDRLNLHKIENTFKKLKNGTFGKCEECGEEIAEKRLLFNPILHTCIDCAEELEKLSKKFGS